MLLGLFLCTFRSSLNYNSDTRTSSIISRIHNSTITVKNSLDLNPKFRTYNSRGKLLGKRCISTTTRQALNNVVSDIPELAPLVAVTLALLVVLPPLVLELRNFISIDAPLTHRIIVNPQDFNEATLEQFEDKLEYIPSLLEGKIYVLTTKLNTFKELLNQVLADHISIPRVLFDELDFIFVKLQAFSSGLSIMVEYYFDVISKSFGPFFNHRHPYWGHLESWADYTQEICDIFLSNYDIFIVSGLIS